MNGSLPRDSTHPGLARLHEPFYTYADADHIAGVTRGTSRRWLMGDRYRTLTGDVVVRPPVTPRPDASLQEGVSFVDLVEIVAIGRLKRIGFSLPRIRAIVEICQEQLGEEHPLATLKFKTDGRDIFVSLGGTLLDASHRRRKGMQAWDEVLGPYLETLDYGHDIARRWWPLGRGTPVVVDPDYGFGFPVIAGSGIRTEIILERFRAGDLHSVIAEDFNITPAEVERALQFEAKRLAA